MTTATPTTPDALAMRFGIFRPLLSVLGVGPKFTTIEIEAADLVVRMGWAFRSHIPLASVTSVTRGSSARLGIGVHGWRGRWLVNGSTKGIVILDIDPPARAWVTFLPVRLRRLHLSLEDPDAAVALLSETARPAQNLT